MGLVCQMLLVAIPNVQYVAKALGEGGCGKGGGQGAGGGGLASGTGSRTRSRRSRQFGRQVDHPNRFSDGFSVAGGPGVFKRRQHHLALGRFHHFSVSDACLAG